MHAAQYRTLPFLFVQAEIALVLSLRHPGLLAVVAHSAMPGGAGLRALVTECPPGGTLEEGLETMTWQERVGAAAAAAGALQFLHTAVAGPDGEVTPVIYRDLTVRGQQTLEPPRST